MLWAQEPPGNSAIGLYWRKLISWYSIGIWRWSQQILVALRKRQGSGATSYMYNAKRSREALSITRKGAFKWWNKAAKECWEVCDWQEWAEEAHYYQRPQERAAFSGLIGLWVRGWKCYSWSWRLPSRRFNISFIAKTCEKSQRHRAPWWTYNT